MQAAVMKALGIVPVLIPINEVPEAIARGTIDGTAIQPVPMVDFGVVRVVQYHYFAGLGFTPADGSHEQEEVRQPVRRPARSSKSTVARGSITFTTSGSARPPRLWSRTQKGSNHKVIYPTAAEKKNLDAAFSKVITSGRRRARAMPSSTRNW